jgi:regulatory protein
MTSRRAERAAARRARRAEVTDPSVVIESAAAFLAVRPRSVAETRRRLRQLGYGAELVEEVLGRMLELEFLDDTAFAQAWVESRDRARPRGEMALRRELALKGIDRALVDEVLGERGAARAGLGPRSEAEAHGADEAERASVDEDAARRLIERRLPALLRESDPRRRRQKAYALLARNGFDPETCRATIAAVLPADG